MNMGITQTGEEQTAVHINEAARSKLKELWQANYARNIRKLIPDIASELDNDRLFVAGVTITQATG